MTGRDRRTNAEAVKIERKARRLKESVGRSKEEQTRRRERSKTLKKAKRCCSSPQPRYKMLGTRIFYANIFCHLFIHTISSHQNSRPSQVWKASHNSHAIHRGAITRKQTELISCSFKDSRGTKQMRESRRITIETMNVFYDRNC